MNRIVSTLRASARALAFSLWTGALFTMHLAGRALLSERGSRRWLVRLQRAWARGTLRILGARIRLAGDPPAAPFFLVANHLSYIDVAVLHAFAPCSFVVKAEVEHWPAFGWLTRATGHVFVNRERMRDLPRALGELEAHLDAGTGVAVFAEATSSPGARVLPFRSPFFALPARGGRPVHYAALSYRTPAGSPPASEAVCWWGDMPFAPHFWKLLGLPGFEAQLAFGAQPVSSADPKDLARRAHAAVSARLIPVTQDGREPPLRDAVGRVLAVLGQGIELLEKLDSARYGEGVPGLDSRGIGPHVRHLVEFFGALARDLPSGWIDYDVRARDARIEAARDAALEALHQAAKRIAALAALDRDPELYVRQDGSDWSRSTLARELGVLHSHAVHHYSLIALLLRGSGHEPPAELGVAPATLAYWRTTGASAKTGV